MAKGKGKKDKAAEEQRRREEEQRLLEEKLRAEYEANEKRWRESLDEYFGSNASQLDKETEHSKNFQQQNLASWKSSAKAQKDLLEWEKFLSCNLFPDVSSVKSMNMYIAIWKEEFSIDCQNNEEWMEKILQLEKIADALEDQMSIAIDGCEDSGQKTQEVLKNVRQTIDAYYEKITTEVLNYSDFFPKEQEENFRQSFKNDYQRLAIWGNSTKNPRFKAIEFPGIVTASIPKPVTPVNCAIVFRLETASSAVQGYDAASGTIVGGLLHLNMLELPTPATSFKKWKVRASYPHNLPRLDYPFPITNIDNEEEVEKLKAQFPSTVQVVLPSETNICPEALGVRWWDSKSRQWMQEGITNVEIDVVTKSVKFDTQVFKTIAFVQSRLTEYPLKSWETRPEASIPNQINLILEGNRNKVEIAVRERQCCLLSPITPEMETVWRNKWYTPTLFFKKLALIGLDFIGPEESLQATFRLKKMESLKSDINSAIGAFGTQLRFRQSPWNTQIAPEKVAFEVTQLEAENPEQVQWKTVVTETLTRPEREYIIAFFLGEAAKPELVRFAPDFVDKGFGSLYHALESVSTEAKSSAPFTRTLQQVFDIVKPWAM